LGDGEGQYARYIMLGSVRCSTTPVPLGLFHESTGLDAYPEALQSSVRDGVLQYACNSEIRYRLRGISVRQTAEWRQREPEGAGDLHRLTIRGSRCHVLVRQDEETGSKARLHLVPAAGVALESMLHRVRAQWQEHFPGLVGESSSRGVCLRLPPALERGHERQFALVLNTFLD